MARTINEIYNSLLNEKQTFSTLSGLTPAVDNYQTLLQDLSTTSKVAIWRLLFYVIAVAIHAQEVYYDLFFEELNTLKPTLTAGTDLWYSEKAKEFEYGNTLSWNGSQYVYSTPDDTLKIVEFSSAITEGSLLYVKVAKDGGGGTPEKLTNTEKTAFDTYINDIGFAGTEIIVISNDGDLLKLALNIYVNPTVIANDGTSVLTGDPVIEDAIDNYLAELDFNGVFRIMDLVDALQAISGVNNVVITTCQAAVAGTTTYFNILTTASQSYIAYAGYMVEDPNNLYSITIYTT